MTTTVLPPISDVQHIVLHDIGWEFYEALLREVGDRRIYINYDSGTLEIMAPLPEHERWKKIIGSLIETLSLKRNIAVEPLGSTTFRREDLAKGLEPDECYYIRHEEAVRGKKQLDLQRDPPPDLVVEVDITHRDVNRVAVYVALGVPEIWRFDGENLTALHLDEKGEYRASEHSLAFPFLRLADLRPFLGMVDTKGRTAALRAFWDWLE